MASTTQKITYAFSRQKNGLCEVQRWWPAYIRNDGVGGLTVDPVLFRSTFGPNTIADEGRGLMDMANTAGIRVEMLNFDGTDPTGTPTVEISGSGTLDAKATITWSDGTKTDWHFVAPSADGKNTTSGYGTQAITASGSMRQAGVASATLAETAGPYPVFATLQDFVDFMDGLANRLAGAVVASTVENTWKKAFLPAGLIDPSTSAWPSANADPRATNTDAMPTGSTLIATIFMPLLLDNNQLKNAQTGGCNNDIIKGYWDGTTVEDGSGNSGAYMNFYDEGLTRHSQQPDATVAPLYKELGNSGDHKVGTVGSFHTTSHYYNQENRWDFMNPDIDPSSSAYGGPSYRMRTALAVFLQDGIYTLKGGSIIPYTYDPDRTIGGRDGNTCYAVWNGKKGMANTATQITAVDTDDMTSAQIWPLFEFVQGPLCPAGQGWNWDGDSSNLYTYHNWIYMTEQLVEKKAELDANPPTFSQGYTPQECALIPQPRRGLVRPNPIRSKIFAASQLDTASCTGLTITDSGTAAGIMTVWIEQTGSQTISFPSGMPIYLKFSGKFKGMTDAYGQPLIQFQMGMNGEINGEDADDLNLWLTGQAADGVLVGADRSGWWIPTTSTPMNVAKNTIVAGVAGTFIGTKLEFVINQGVNLDSTQNIAAYLDNGYACQGLMGGAEIEYATGTLGSGDWPYQPPAHPASGTLKGTSLAELSVAQNKYNIGPCNQVMGLGVYLMGQANQMGMGMGGQSAPSCAGHNFGSPTRTTMSPQAVYLSDYSGYIQDDLITPRGTQIAGADDRQYAIDPTAQGIGGGMLRLPAPPNSGWADYYFSPTNPAPTAASGTQIGFGDFGGKSGGRVYGSDFLKDNNIFSNAFNGVQTGWNTKSVVIPLMSVMEQATGKHSWDYTKPAGWSWGRNRLWPVHERIGTKGGYGPFTSFNYWGIYNKGVATTGNRPPIGDESILTGLTEIGCSPVWLDLELRAWWPVQSNRITIIEYDTGTPSIYFGRHSFTTRGGILGNWVAGFLPIVGSGKNYVEWSSWQSLATESQTTQHAGNCEMWLWGGASMFDGTAFDASGWINTKTDPPNGWVFSGAMGSNNLGWGNMSNGYGTGTPTTLSEGYHIIRTTFDEAGMNLQIDGSNVGKDLNVNNPVWGFSIQAGNASGAAARHTTSPIKDANNYNLWPTGQAYNKSQADLQIDEMIVRHIPSMPMCPFPVDSITQKITGVGKYSSLSVEALGISTGKGMNLKVSICPVVANTGGRQIEGGTPYDGFEALDLGIIGGYGSVDLTQLPADAITNGFIIRWLFYVPTASDTSLHPVDWSTTPIIRAWTLEYDLSPDATLSCIGNTFNGDIVAPISTKVGHIMSFRGTAITTDVDRLVSQVKFDFGDGITTDWLSFADQNTQSNTFDTAHSYLTTGTYAATVQVKDDAGNTTTSAAVSVVVANAAPVAVLRAVPSLVRAGDVATLDATDSFDVNAGGSLTSYTFNFGDGSGIITQGSPTAQHTYATAGEYMATLTCVDTDGTVSQTASSVLKVIPATLVVPLVFNTKPRAFNRTRSAEIGQTPVLDAVYPEMTDTGQRQDVFTLTGSFLKATANSDIQFVEELLLSGALVEFLWEDVDYSGNPSGKTFTGRLQSFDYQREGGKHGETPYSISIAREAGLGV